MHYEYNYFLLDYIYYIYWNALAVGIQSWDLAETQLSLLLPFWPHQMEPAQHPGAELQRSSFISQTAGSSGKTSWLKGSDFILI